MGGCCLSEGYVVQDLSFMSHRFVVPFVVQIVPAFESQPALDSPHRMMRMLAGDEVVV